LRRGAFLVKITVMPAHEIFFFGALFFLLGILLGSAGFGFLVPWFVGACLFGGLLFYFFKKRKSALWIAGLSLVALLGTLYFHFDDTAFRAKHVPTEGVVEFSGVVSSDPARKGDIQEFVLTLQGPVVARVLVRTSPHPAFRYGDAVQGSGRFTVPESISYLRYLSKERIVATVSYPRLARIASGGGSPVFRFLFDVKHSVMNSISDLLPAKEAALLNGLLLGDTTSFSEEFSLAMKQSGTTHLVALSGYNITIVLWAVLSICAFFVSRRTSVIVAFGVMVGFVLMTGAEASVVRAAIMGSIVLLAGEMGRPHDTRNAILFAALLMALWNPKVLVFDVGFQLSFFALLGIVYLRPALEGVLGKKKRRFSSFRETFFTTLAAQLAVLPILLSQFGSVSAAGLFSNLLVLEVVPLTMGLGFLTAGLGMLWHTLAVPFGWLLWVPLRFQIGVIEWFGGLGWNITGEWGIVPMFFYYGAFVFFIRYAERFI